MIEISLKDIRRMYLKYFHHVNTEYNMIILMNKSRTVTSPQTPIWEPLHYGIRLFGALEDISVKM